jgi:pilus assembly protein CpaC
MRNTAGSASVRVRVLFCLTLCVAFGTLAAQAEDVTVIKGASTKIAVSDGIKRIVIGNPAIIDAKPDEDARSAVVTGLTEGSSELRIERLQGTDLVYRVTVRADLQAMMDQIKELLSDVVGLEIKTVGNRIVFEGNIITQSNWEKIKKVEAAYAGAVLNMATFDQKAMAGDIRRAILNDLGTIGVDTVTVEVSGDTAILDGVVYSDADLARVMEKAKLRMPNVRSLLQVRQLMIETDVQFVEVDTSLGSDMGNNVLQNLTLSGSYSGGNSAKPSLMASAQATATINAVLNNANTKTINQIHISAVSGTEGHSKLGGTSYFPVAGNVGGSLVPVEYGVIVKVKPTMQGRDRILNEISVEVSAPVVSGTGPFTVTTFTTGTAAMCKVGESIILSGFAQALSSQTSNKTPVLGDIPLLNLFFGEKTKSRARKQLVLLLTPRLVVPETTTPPPLSDASRALLEAPSGAQK